MSLMNTTQMLDAVKKRGYVTECSISNHGLRATHWIEYWAGRYYDEGMDGEKRRTSRKAMLQDYPRTIWQVTEDGRD